MRDVRAEKRAGHRCRSAAAGGGGGGGAFEGATAGWRVIDRNQRRGLVVQLAYELRVSLAKNSGSGFFVL